MAAEVAVVVVRPPFSVCKPADNDLFSWKTPVIGERERGERWRYG